jgi:HD-GYP domain-containing protein (c-di-GMP phosphodiesterase class II)/HAMP domain-containing protein
MQLGTEFLKSKIARRFCLLFILCAFVPTLALVVLSYNKVIDQLEEQSLNRLKREATAYGFSLFDRMIRLDNELQIIGRNIEDGGRNNSGNQTLLSNDNEPLFSGVYLCNEEKKIIPVFGTADTGLIESLWREDLQEHDKPFILSLPHPGENGRVFFGTNMRKIDKNTISIIGEVRPEYLWGVGPSPILPPMTELSVYDKNGSSIMASVNAPDGDYAELPDQYTSQEPGVYRFEKNGKTFFASTSNLFVEARFQQTGWHILLSQARTDMMSSVENFRQSFPFVILLFLLLILYLSVLFIRKGLEPLEQLKEGTKRIALKDFSKKVDIRSGDEFEELGESFNEMAGKLDNQFHALNVLGEIDRAILSSVNKTQILATTLQSYKNFFRCDIVLFVTNIMATKGHVNAYIMQGQRKDDPHRKYYVLEEGEHEKLFTDSDHEIVQDKESYPGFLKSIDGEQLSKLLYLPLKIGGKVNRVLILGWFKDHRFQEDELDQARQVANQLAVALTNSKLLEDMEKLAMGTIQALARTVDAKSKWTAGHSERVSALGGRIAKVMGISGKEIDTIIRGGLLHDIGKIGIPVAILDKPEGLTDQELTEIRNHPAIGAKILEPITAYHDILPLVLYHHEKFDGSGYPDGLKGDEIDIRARILAVADVWDALVSERPYREGWVQDRAKKMIVDGSGSHFDPRVVEAFMAIVDMG